MKGKFQKLIDNLSIALLDKDKSAKIIGTSTYVVLAAVSFVMTAVNLITEQNISLSFCTAIFGVLNIINFIFCLSSLKGAKIARVLVTIEFYIMFLYFLVWGYPEGFSAIWICMLPPVSMLFYGVKRGSIISGGMMLILIFFLWTPFGNSLLQHECYTATFEMRFPLLYFAFYAIALILEMLRAMASDQAQKLSDNYKLMSTKDQLTQVYNRVGIYDSIKRHFDAGFYKVGFAILDIDFFKKVNDTYGHMVGDKVLVDFANILLNNLNATICRWGGEEFAIIFYNDNVSKNDLENLLVTIANHPFKYDGIEPLKITASLGVYQTISASLKLFDKYMQKADTALYTAKETGRNKVVYYDSTQKKVAKK